MKTYVLPHPMLKRVLLDLVRNSDHRLGKTLDGNLVSLVLVSDHVEEGSGSIGMTDSPAHGALVGKFDVRVGEDGEDDFLVFGKVDHLVLKEGRTKKDATWNQRELEARRRPEGRKMTHEISFYTNLQQSLVETSRIWRDEGEVGPRRDLRVSLDSFHDRIDVD